MAVNVKDTSYRKVDVDFYDPEKYQEAEAIYDPAYGNSSGPNESAVKQLLQSNKLSEALVEGLKNIPLKTHDENLKDRSVQLLLRVLTAFKANEVETSVKNLNTKQLAILLHYILKCFEVINDSQASQQLCAWHCQIFNVGGHGILNQVLASRYRL
ncbi:Actin-related protein 2/3 complex subunit 5 [Aphelenchoides bicaudatus]|nr:Actin-related protein 2/3 complex subunit 5 [Aphelenchoides bicaudatus]